MTFTAKDDQLNDSIVGKNNSKFIFFLEKINENSFSSGQNELKIHIFFWKI